MVGLQQLILATHRLGVGETKFNICFENMKSLFLFVYVGVTGLRGGKLAGQKIRINQEHCSRCISTLSVVTSQETLFMFIGTFMICTPTLPTWLFTFTSYHWLGLASKNYLVKERGRSGVGLKQPYNNSNTACSQITFTDHLHLSYSSLSNSRKRIFNKWATLPTQVLGMRLIV